MDVNGTLQCVFSCSPFLLRDIMCVRFIVGLHVAVVCSAKFKVAPSISQSFCPFYSVDIRLVSVLLNRDSVIILCKILCSYSVAHFPTLGSPGSSSERDLLAGSLFLSAHPDQTCLQNRHLPGGVRKGIGQKERGWTAVRSRQRPQPTYVDL